VKRLEEMYIDIENKIEFHVIEKKE